MNRSQYMTDLKGRLPEEDMDNGTWLHILLGDDAGVSGARGSSPDSRRIEGSEFDLEGVRGSKGSKISGSSSSPSAWLENVLPIPIFAICRLVRTLVLLSSSSSVNWGFSSRTGGSLNHFRSYISLTRKAEVLVNRPVPSSYQIDIVSSTKRVMIRTVSRKTSINYLRVLKLTCESRERVVEDFFGYQ
jgi:hypothetical protein